MSFIRSGLVCLAGFTALGAVMAAGAATAQTAPPRPQPPPLSKEQINPAAQTPQRRQRPTDVFSGPPREICQLSDDPGLGFVFKSGSIEDPSHVLSDQDKQTAWGNALGRNITPHELCEIRDRLAQRIFRKGVLARVVIPPQTIAGGVVKFHVIAAKIVSVRFDGDDVGPSQAKVEAYLNHLRQQNTFNLDTAQRWLLLVNDIPGIQATAKIVHSAAPGAPPEGLDLIVTVKRVPVDEFGEVSNVNAAALGPWSAIARADFNSLTGLGERTSLIAYSTVGNNRQQVAQVLETVKIGDSGLFGAASFAFGHSRPGDILKELNLTGESFSGTIELDYPLIRLQRRSLVLASGMDFVNQTTTFPGGQALADDALRVVWVRADASASAVDRPVMDNLISTAADLSIQARKGLNVLGASPPSPASSHLSRSEGRADAWVIRADSHALLRITPDNPKFVPLTFSLHFMGQWSDRPLLAFEEQAIGNLSIGRGYDPDAASGDRVAAGEFKFEIGPMKLTKTARMTPYVFFDRARVTNLDSQSQDVTLRSVGGGVQLRFPYDARGDAVRVDFGYAKPLDKAFPSQTQKPPGRWLLQVIVAH